MQQNSNRSKLQERLAAELQAKAARKAADEGKASSLPDGVTDSAYLKDTSQTNSKAWVWILLVILGAGSLLYFAILR